MGRIDGRAVGPVGSREERAAGTPVEARVHWSKGKDFGFYSC